MSRCRPRGEGPRQRDSRLLHVARAVRTKGLRDCIRALALLPRPAGGDPHPGR